jgi:hypothetical protein
MKMSLANTLIMFLAALLIAASARADDAAIRKQLVGQEGTRQSDHRPER